MRNKFGEQLLETAMMSSENIVVIDPNTSGGICHYTFALCNALAELGRPVLLLTSRAEYELKSLKRRFFIVPLLYKIDPSRLRRTNVRLIQDWLIRYWRRQLGAEVGAYIQKAHAQVLHQQWMLHPETEPAFWRAMWCRLDNRPPLVYTAHNVFPHESNPKLERAYRKAYRYPDRIILHGEVLRRYATEDAGIPESKTRSVRHGNYHFLANLAPVPSPEQARLALGMDADDRVVLFFGFIRPYKGLDVLMHAFEHLLRQQTNGRIKLLVAGTLLHQGTWETSGYAELARRLKLENALQIYSEYIPIGDFGQYFAAADLVCFPYRSGSQSGALQLAYAFRKPVVATRVGSLPEAVIEGETGLLVAPEDSGALADALAMLLNDPVCCERMGEHGYEWSGDEFAWSRIAKQTMAIYEGITSG